MALETLRGLDSIGGFKTIIAENGSLLNAFPEEDGPFPIQINLDHNSVAVQIQNGPIKEVGVNGAQVETLVEIFQRIVEGLQEKFPYDENAEMIVHAQAILDLSAKRKADR